MSRRRSIAVSDDTWIKIKLHAVASGRTPSEIVEEACRRLLEDRYGTKAVAAPLKDMP